MAHPLRFAALVFAALLAACSDSRPSLPGGGDFVLRSADGPFDTRAQRGKVLLLFFGYTNCPDVCPTFLGNGAQALNRLTAQERSRVRIVLVGVDPARDTPAKLKEYTAFFHPEMIGITGTPDEVAAVARQYGAVFVLQPPRPDGAYAVDHSAQTYVVGPDGRLAAFLGLGTPPDEVAAAVRKLL